MDIHWCSPTNELLWQFFYYFFIYLLSFGSRSSGSSSCCFACLELCSVQGLNLIFSVFCSVFSFSTYHIRSHEDRGVGHFHVKVVLLLVNINVQSFMIVSLGYFEIVSVFVVCYYNEYF